MQTDNYRSDVAVDCSLGVYVNYSAGDLFYLRVKVRKNIFTRRHIEEHTMTSFLTPPPPPLPCVSVSIVARIFLHEIDDVAIVEPGYCNRFRQLVR